MLQGLTHVGSKIQLESPLRLSNSISSTHVALQSSHSDFTYLLVTVSPSWIIVPFLQLKRYYFLHQISSIWLELHLLVSCPHGHPTKLCLSVQIKVVRGNRVLLSKVINFLLYLFMYLSSPQSSVSCWPELPSRTAFKSSTLSSVLWSLISFPRSRWEILFSITRILRRSLNQASSLPRNHAQKSGPRNCPGT